MLPIPNKTYNMYTHNTRAHPHPHTYTHIHPYTRTYAHGPTSSVLKYRYHNEEMHFKPTMSVL